MACPLGRRIARRQYCVRVGNICPRKALGLTDRDGLRKRDDGEILFIYLPRAANIYTQSILGCSAVNRF